MSSDVDSDSESNLGVSRNSFLECSRSSSALKIRLSCALNLVDVDEADCADVTGQQPIDVSNLSVGVDLDD